MNNSVFGLGKRGFGMPQVLALFLLVIVGGVFIIAANINVLKDAPVGEVGVADMLDHEGHIILMSLLRTPMTRVDELPFIKDPTIADFIVMKEFGRVGSEKTKNTVLLQTIVGDQVLGPLYNISEYRSFGYKFYVDDVMITQHNIIDKKCSDIVRKDKPLLHEVNTLVPGPKGNKNVRLVYCWLPGAKQ